MIIDKEIKDFIEKHLTDNIRELALKSAKFNNINISFALQQITCRQKAKNKLPTWYKLSDIIYPEKLALEQCSSELTARYKASLISKGNIFVDLTGGLGVDFAFIAPLFHKSYYVEKQTSLTEIAKHNFKILELNQSIIINEESEYFLNNFDCLIDTLFIDPARRNSVGNKIVLIEDCSPDILSIDSLLNDKVKNTLIKLSPMLDIQATINKISNITDIHIISVGGECKELLIIKRKDVDCIPIIHCINIISNYKFDLFSFTKKEENELIINYSSDLKKYLYEPNSSILKAGAYKSVAKKFNLEKLDKNSHLYTSDELISDFPGRKFLIDKLISPNKKELKLYLSNIKKANICTRNYPLSVDQIKKQLKIDDGGETYIFATTLFNEKKVLILCSKLP